MNDLMARIQTYIPLILFPGLGCFMACFLTMVCIRVMPVLGFIDYPGGRHIHRKPVPKAGGTAIVTAFIVVLTVYGLMKFSTDNNYEFIEKISRKVFLPALFLGAVGLYDDRIGLPAKWKLLGQILAAFVAWLFDARMDVILNWHLPVYLSCAFSVIWIVAFINAFNLIDGIDGLASGLGIVSSSCMAVWFLFTGNIGLAVLCLTLAGCSLGFLIFNFHPAKIFMGDTGSMFIGFVIAVVGITSLNKAAALSSVMVPILAAGVPIFDVFLAIWRRLSRRMVNKMGPAVNSGTRIMGADREHLHHRLLDRSQNQAKTAFYLYLMGLVFAAGSIFLMFNIEKHPALAFVVVLSAFVFVIRRFATVEMWNSAQLIIQGVSRPKRTFLISMIHPFIDMFCLVLSFVLAVVLFSGLNDIGLADVMTIVAIPILGLHLSKCYRVYWVRASLHNYRVLAETLLVSFIIGGFIAYYWLFKESVSGYFVTMYIFYSVLSLSMILGERFALRYFESVMLKNIYLNRFQNSEKVSNCLVYGAGVRTRLFLNYIAVRFQDEPLRVVGLLDEDPVLKGLYVHGCRVLGGSGMLEQIYAKDKFDQIIITVADMDPANQRRVIEFCRRHNLTLSKFTLNQEVLLYPDKTRKMD